MANIGNTLLNNHIGSLFRQVRTNSPVNKPEAGVLTPLWEFTAVLKLDLNFIFFDNYIKKKVSAVI